MILSIISVISFHPDIYIWRTNCYDVLLEIKLCTTFGSVISKFRGRIYQEYQGLGLQLTRHWICVRCLFSSKIKIPFDTQKSYLLTDLVYTIPTNLQVASYFVKLQAQSQSQVLTLFYTSHTSRNNNKNHTKTY